MRIYALWSISEDSEGQDHRTLLSPLYRTNADAMTALAALRAAAKLRTLEWWDEGSRGYEMEILRVKL